MNRHRWFLVSAGAILIASCAGWLVSREYGNVTQAQNRPVTTASEMLATLQVEAESQEPYERSYFGRGLTKSGAANCSSTRTRVLLRDSKVKAHSSASCKAVIGKWKSQYDDVLIATSNHQELQVDHVVPVAEAWASGASKWTSEQRHDFFNDLVYPHSLIAVSAKSNDSKKDKQPSEWMPSNLRFQCVYIGYWIAVKYRWSLSVDSAERADLENRLKECGNRSDVEIPTKASLDIVDATSSVPVLSTPSSSLTGQRYSSCTQVHAHKLGPYVRGKDPEYYWYRDGDGDGTVCE